MGSMESVLGAALGGLGSLFVGDKLFASFLGSIETNLGSFGA
ncbi:hypothetical protein [Rhodococcus sp. IEGM 1379]|nr:hypothetical protein [Rhodococcus sp. IEGM 1379]MDI9917335.1 hypothetical protein [Rhodococcus sp. IEGM 1379]